jgi:hypothetical protein
MFYTYLWLRYSGVPYYVGKGKNRRAYQIHDNLRPPKSRDRIIVEYHNNEQDAYEAEKFLIAYYGRLDINTGCLRNLADGGDGPIGRKGKPHTEQWKQEISARLKGRKLSQEHRDRISATKKGLKQSPEHREKNRAARLGRKLSESTRRKMSESWTGYTMTPEQVEACRERAKGNQNWRVREARRRGFM